MDYEEANTKRDRQIFVILWGCYSLSFKSQVMYVEIKEKIMDKESVLLLQEIDCNCNNCKYFIRDIEKTKKLNNNDKIVASKIHYGKCDKLNKNVAEIANICLLHTQDCFENRRSIKFERVKSINKK